MTALTWQLVERDPTTLELFIPAVPFGRKVIATIGVGFAEPWESQQRAHARLLLAAPDMLAKLEEIAGECAHCSGSGIAEDLHVDCTECRDIRAVIAQAK